MSKTNSSPAALALLTPGMAKASDPQLIPTRESISLTEVKEKLGRGVDSRELAKLYPACADMIALVADNMRLKAQVSKPAGRTSLKLTEKGGVSVYGLGRFPVTLYAGQWERLLALSDDIKAFLELNADKLSRKE